MRRILLVVALALVAAACGSGGDGIPSTTGGPDTGPTTPTTTQDQPARLLLQITEEGGFAPVEFVINRLPNYSLYTDGVLLAPAAFAAVFPGPMLAPVQHVRLGPDHVEDVMTLIEAVGLPEMEREIDDTLTNRVADATTTMATYFDSEGTAHVYGAYALGLTMDEPASDATLNLGALRDLLDRFIAEGAASADYVPDRLQLRLNDTPFVDPALSETRPWPLDVSPAEFEPSETFNWPCYVLDGDAAQNALAAFSAANQATLWDFERTEYQILARALLPGEQGCAL